MSRHSPSKSSAAPISSSTFTLTFVIEILNIDVFHDCQEGFIDLGPCSMGMKIQYQLYIGQRFDVDIMAWPHVAKVWCGQESSWVRTFLYLERRWMAFSIRHALPVRVMDLRSFEVVVTPNFGVESLSSAARSDKTFEVYIPKLEFGERRYFGRVIPHIESDTEALVRFIRNAIWDAVNEFIPASFMDGQFDVPHPVTDIRHQDAAFQYIQETTFNRKHVEKDEDSPRLPKAMEPSLNRTKINDGKGKKADTKNVYYLRLTGNDILAGAGRVVPFEVYGEPSLNMGELAVFISSANLPAIDDVPILFINVEKLIDAPITEFKKYKIMQLFIKWKVGENEHVSEANDLTSTRTNSGDIKFNDHYAIPLDPVFASVVTASFLDDLYEIELWGKILPPADHLSPKFFGYEKGDKDFNKYKVAKYLIDDNETSLETMIAVTKIDAKHMAKGIQAFIRGEYPLYPPRRQVVFSERESLCTNDINAIGSPVKPAVVFPPSIVLKSQMSLEVSMGVVGCKPPKLTAFFSRMYCLISYSASIMAILMKIKNINEMECESKCDLLTGFAIDTGEHVVLFLEGPKDGKILHVWEQTADFYPKVKPIFSSSARYSLRVYPELVNAAIPFMIMKMFVPLTATLACPPVYARPVFPVPARSAVLKLGRLIAHQLRVMPGRSDLPTFNELQSFKLELCTPQRPPLTTHLDNINVTNQNEHVQQASITEAHREPAASTPARINWSKANEHAPLPL